MPRQCAVFTIVQDEDVFLPLWLRYYTAQFPPADVYVLDHDTRDGSVEAAWKVYRPSVVRVHRDESFDHQWLLRTVQSFQRFLLQSYAQVLFAEADEFVVADPHFFPGGLKDYVGENLMPRVRCKGYDVVPRDLLDRPADLTGSLLGHGRRMLPSVLYSKTLLANRPVDWQKGFHRTTDAAQLPPDDRLLLFHLRRFDSAVCLARNKRRMERQWAGEDLARGHGAQSRIVNQPEFDRWFYDRHGESLPIPDRFHTVQGLC